MKRDNKNSAFLRRLAEVKEKREALNFHLKVADLGAKLQDMGLTLSLETSDENMPVCVYEKPNGNLLFRYPNLDGVELFIKG